MSPRETPPLITIQLQSLKSWEPLSILVFIPLRRLNKNIDKLSFTFYKSLLIQAFSFYQLHLQCLGLLAAEVFKQWSCPVAIAWHAALIWSTFVTEATLVALSSTRIFILKKVTCLTAKQNIVFLFQPEG